VPPHSRINASHKSREFQKIAFCAAAEALEDAAVEMPPRKTVNFFSPGGLAMGKKP